MVRKPSLGAFFDKDPPQTDLSRFKRYVRKEF